MAKIVNPLVIVSGGVLDSHTFTNNGTYTPTSIGQAVDGWNEITVNVSSSTPTGKYVNFYDEFGEVLYHIDTSKLPLDELPELPEDITGYTFSWDSTLAQVNAMTDGGQVATVVEVEEGTPTLIFPQDSGFIGTLSLKFRRYNLVDSESIIDWGDGNTETVSITSSSDINVSHTYSSASLSSVSVITNNKVFFTLYGATTTDQSLFAKKVYIGYNFLTEGLVSTSPTNYNTIEYVLLPNGSVDTASGPSFTRCGFRSLSIPTLTRTDISSITLSNNKYVKNIIFNRLSRYPKMPLISGDYSLEYITTEYCTYSGTFSNGQLYSLWSLKEYKMPSGVTGNNSNCGNDLYSLEKLELSPNYASVGDYSFQSGLKLKTITFPATITYIGEYCFTIPTLEEIICLATTPPTLQSTAFMPYGVSNSSVQHLVIRVPSTSVSAYKSDANWSRFADIIVGIEE